MEILNNEQVARRLATAILLQAASDKREIKQKGYVLDGTGQVDEDVNNEELDEFFASDWCGELCEMAGIDHRKVKKKMLCKSK